MPTDVKGETTGTYKPDVATPTYNPDSSSTTASNDEGLQQVIQEWPKLPPAMREGIVAIVQATVDLPETEIRREETRS